ncbi:PIN domain-containing protein [Brasilonema sp. UFV-L1]|uniref:type II toxin-antitoxin system VapC family toxin n=1 Tax=Brasilonema sp. UFV-L1 TaxID=2234130 RepID=UPI00145F06B9|nr:PIN domain-containing protein [Brasilonema sp. UFV-L1]NMG08904.1 VapC toxin family PIN domain ribonuclease [Brasilonema sp. UFV-L1]
MTAILDTSFLFALTDQGDRNHSRVLTIAQTIREPLILPVAVLPEICYLIASRLGHQVMRRFLLKLRASDTKLESLSLNDIERVNEILEQYADSQLDFTDAAIIALAERENITLILTLDRRDFTLVRPKHCEYFELLP